MKNFVIFIILALLTSCSSVAAPNFINGKYYLAGDENCARYSALQNGRILCFNSKTRQASGYRDPMTDQQIQMYQFQAAQAQQQEQALQQQIYQNNQQFVYNIPQYTPPQIMPLVRPGGEQIRCLSVGIYTNCRSY